MNSYWTESRRRHVATLAMDNSMAGRKTVFLQVPNDQVFSIRERGGRRFAVLHGPGDSGGDLIGEELQYDRREDLHLVAFPTGAIMEHLFPGILGEIESETNELLSGRIK